MTFLITILTWFSDSTFNLPIDNVDLMANENFQEATLIDMDIKELFHYCSIY